LTTSDNDLGIAIGNLLHAERYGAQTRAAQLVQAPGWALLRHASGHSGLTGRALTGTGLKHLAENDLINICHGDICARHGGLNGNLTELARGQSAQGTIERAHGRAGGRYDDDFTHDSMVLRFFATAKRPRQASPVMTFTMAISLTAVIMTMLSGP
jgi:hypothetical protein